VREAAPREIAIKDGELHLGGLCTLNEIAGSDLVHQHVPALAEAAGGAASPQIRHRATLGGNLCQHTRCGYYRHASFPCFKRGAETCPVLADGAVQDTAGIFGNQACASAHASSLAPVLGAVGAALIVHRPGLKQPLVRIAFDDFYAAPVHGKGSDTTLGPGDVLVCVVVPIAGRSMRTAYSEVRQKAAFDWALTACGVCVDTDAEGKVTRAGVVLGSVAPTPHRAVAVEQALLGKAWTRETALAAAKHATVGATPLPGNRYKIQLADVVVRRALLGALES
jgi:xanthine dehydrogenase YagS FAD-binding subunit